MHARVEFRIVQHGTRECDDLVRLRTDVLRTPLGLTFTREELRRESDQVHIGAYRSEKLVGCLLLSPQEGNKVKMRQVAISPDCQGQGIGKKLVEYSEELAREKGFEEIILSARETAVPFYLALNYEIYGAPFVEVTVPHRSMKKKI